ncbi:hypothetical protein KXV92_003478 [Aspergillus fumigatus]|nr:hypothetical protein KXX42_001911 [Aspergillus fumigatus]KAH1554960.1 hypothetical protein KXX57_004526 [Aspergillus fumigatus]KAH2665396.1 hypothetical protein KXV32_007245 [Aspergillus fumigatus]KAH3190568.1 hypothetical protein KXV92_003478 [Aspergillus fumigatus]
MPANEQRSPESHEEFSHTSSTTTTRSSNSAAWEDVYVEDVSSRDSGYDGDIEVVKPYAIEEPEDEAPRHVPRLAISPAPNDAESWQGELVNSMQDLHCDSDYPDLRCRPSHRRGRKRKTPTVGAGNSVPGGRRQVYEAALYIQYEGPRASPKRLRRRSLRLKEDQRTPLSPRSPTETDSPASPSLSPQSTDASGASPSNKPNISDEMDID